MNGIMMPPRPPKRQSDGLEKPKKLREVPAYVAKLVHGFFSRLFYIVSLVWEAAPWMLVAMIMLCILDGEGPAII